MSMSDPIADMLTRIRNSQNINKKTVLIPSSKEKFAIINILKIEGYINNFLIINIKNKIMIKIYLKYYNDNPVIETLKRISKPSLRIYKKKKFIPKIMNGLGLVIISTSLGIMTDRNARIKGIGGEIICYIT